LFGNVDTVLTSGKHLSAESGLHNLGQWRKESDVTIMAGGGINFENALKFKEAGLKAIHLSGTSFGNEVSVNRKIPINSTKHLEEYHVAVTNTETVRQIIQSVK